MSNVDLVSKLVVFFTLRAVVLETDVLLGKPRDSRAFQSSLGLPIKSLSLFPKNFFFLYEIYFCTSYRAVLYITFIYFFLSLFFLQLHPRTIRVSFVLFALTLIGATRSMAPMTF